jgi:hypothetical protein
MNRDDDKPDLIHLTDMAIDWRYDSRGVEERTRGRRGGLLRLWAFMFRGKAASSESGTEDEIDGVVPPRSTTSSAESSPPLDSPPAE